MHDNGIRLVTLDHADIEEAGVLAVHGVMHERARAVAVVLRRLQHPHFRVQEGGDQVFQPVRVHDVIGIDDCDDLRIRRRVRERQAQRARLVAADTVLIDELETLAKSAAMLLDRLPECRIGRVVDDDHAFKIRIIEPRHGVERGLEHLRRLAMGRHVDRDF